LDQDSIREYLKELNISDIDISGSRLDLYKLSRLFLDFFFFFNRTSNNYLFSGFSIEVQDTGKAIEKQGAKKNPYLSNTRGSCNNDSVFITT
jgi:hypothetical protein